LFKFIFFNLNPRHGPSQKHVPSCNRMYYELRISVPVNILLWISTIIINQSKRGRRVMRVSRFDASDVQNINVQSRLIKVWKPPTQTPQIPSPEKIKYLINSREFSCNNSQPCRCPLVRRRCCLRNRPLFWYLLRVCRLPKLLRPCYNCTSPHIIALFKTVSTILY